MSELSELTAISPVDGRYHGKTEALGEYLSEYGLIKSRVKVEAALFVALTGGALPDVPKLDDRARDAVLKASDEFSVEDAAGVKELEGVLNHDVKAVEVWLRNKFADDPVLSQYLELIHFGVTSEDINNNAYNLMVSGAIKNVIDPAIGKVAIAIDEKAQKFADAPMLGETHGQPATPTTVGKELAVFARRYEEQREDLYELNLSGKMNGATGTYGAMVLAYPEVDWPQFSKDFVESLGFAFNSTTTQIEPHDQLAEVFNKLAQINTLNIDTSRDIWEYISRRIFKLIPKQGEVGSSTMPHKVNPIDFENAEGNAGISTALLRHLADKLPVSRLQRDLSDSTALRAIGPAFGHALLSLSSMSRGLGKIDVDEAAAREELNSNWAVLAEAIQMAGRRYGVKDIYNRIKDATRGVELTQAEYRAIVEDMWEKDEIPQEAYVRLIDLTPETYIGLAPQIARREDGVVFPDVRAGEA
jgi:adenylosuccinate lyase